MMVGSEDGVASQVSRRNTRGDGQLVLSFGYSANTASDTCSPPVVEHDKFVGGLGGGREILAGRQQKILRTRQCPGSL